MPSAANPPASPAATRPLAAFCAACAGVALFSLMDAGMKGLALALGAYGALFWRNVAGTLLSGGVWLASGRPMPARAVLRLHLWRGAVVAAMAILFFWSITVLPLAEAIALSFIAPIIALFLAALLLGERITRSTIFASLLGLAGVGIIMAARIGSDAHDSGALWGVAAVLGSAVLFAYNLVLARQQAQLAGPAEISFFQTATVLACLTPFAPWFLALPAPDAVPMIVAVSSLAVASLFIMAWAYARAEAQVLIPVEYTAFVWAALCGWYFFGEALTWPVIGGTVLIVTGCLIAARASARPQGGQVEEIFA